MMSHTRKFVPFIIVIALLAGMFPSAGNASAWSQCPNSIVVQWGDTLTKIAKQCDTTVDAIRAANPGLGWWLYAGQTLYIPNGSSAPSYNTYVVQTGDTLGKIAYRGGTTVYALLAVNPQISNPSLIYAGQVIYLPTGVTVPPPAPHPVPTTPTTPPPSNVSWSYLKIDYKNGMYVRAQPGGTIIASALNGEKWLYNKSSLFIDSNWKVWVEVKLVPPVKGYTTGWILVKDQLGNYFTDPQLGK